MRWLSTSWTGAAPLSNRFDLHEQDIANGSIIQNIVDYPRYCRLSKILSQAGSVTFDGETIEGAPPLWCAAAAGQIHL